MVAVAAVLVLCAMCFWMSLEVLDLMDKEEAAQTIGEVRRYNDKIVQMILQGTGTITVAFTIFAGLIFRLSDEKPPQVPSVPLDAHLQALAALDAHRADQSRIVEAHLAGQRLETERQLAKLNGVANNLENSNA